MTLDDIATANKMSIQELFELCWRWRTGYKYPPKATIREDLRLMNTHCVVPPYVQDYMAQFNDAKGHA